MTISEYWEDQISVFNVRGERIRTIRSRDNCPEQMVSPREMAIDDMDNIYVCSQCQLQKFTNSGELTECIRKIGSNEVEFDPIGITIHSNYVYVCDGNNHCIQVFDMDLTFIKSIGSYGKGEGEFTMPEDIKFDTSGNMYVADFGNYRVQVLDSSGHFIRVFGEEQREPHHVASLHIIDKYVYASATDNYIVVYKTSGEFVTLFGGEGDEEGEFMFPASIASCPNGFVYVCDFSNNRVQIF